MHSTMVVGGSVLLRFTLHRTMPRGRSATVDSSMDGGVLLMLTVHRTMTQGRSATVHSAIGGGVLMMLVVHRTMKGTAVTIHGTIRVGGFTGNLARRWGAGTGLLDTRILVS